MMAHALRIAIGTLLIALFVGGCLNQAFASSTDANTLMMLNPQEYPLARCLDGSSSGFYYRKGADANKFMIILEGGGICTGREDCIQRATTDLGSSRNWSKTFDWSAWPITTANIRNPFASWNQVWIKYCDGSIWSGARTTATNETFGLFFSGHHTISAALEMLSKKDNLNSSTSPATVVFAGGSAGGLGAFSNVDYVQERLPFARVLGSPIGGYVPNITWYNGPGHTTPSEDVRDNAFKKHAVLFDSYFPSGCKKALAAVDQYKCLIPRLLYPYSKVPLFVIEALTDSCVLDSFEGVPFPLFAPNAAKEFMSDYGANASSTFRQVLNNPRDGVFAASCFLHCGFTLDGPLINGSNVADALHKWVIGGANNNWIDRCPDNKYWPTCGTKCPIIPKAGSFQDYWTTS